jgi:hypothetical protein
MPQQADIRQRLVGLFGAMRRRVTLENLVSKPDAVGGPWPFYDLTEKEVRCTGTYKIPDLADLRKVGRALDPSEGGRGRYVRTARIVSVEKAAYRSRRDRLDDFLALARDFL